MSDEEKQSVSGHFPDDWGVGPEEVKTQIRRFLTGSNCIFSGELEDRTQEILQETIQRYIRYIKGNGAASVRKPREYILKIAKNVCLEFVNERKKKLEKEVRLPPSSALESDGDSCPVEPIYDEWNQPEQVLLSKEELDHVFSLIEKLPQPLRDVIRLKAEGAQLREIARRASIPLDDVRGYLQEGQKQLQQLLRQ